MDTKRLDTSLPNINTRGVLLEKYHVFCVELLMHIGTTKDFERSVSLTTPFFDDINFVINFNSANIDADVTVGLNF